jgi:hypothetical protein
MNWDKLDLHMENLIPGIVLVALLMIGWPFPLGALSQQTTILAAAFVGAAYLLGTFVNLLSRLLLDRVNRATLRAPFFRVFAPQHLPKGPVKKETINELYSLAISTGMSCGNPRIESEVAKRRQTGRLMRSALVPGVVATILIAHSQGWSSLGIAGIAFGLYLVLMILYAYAEVAVFQEGKRGQWYLDQHFPKPGVQKTSARPVTTTSPSA